MIDEQLKQAVMSEALRLRKFADPSDLANLSFDDLKPDSTEFCVYGQLSKEEGGCFSDKAVALFKKCAVPFSHSIYSNNGDPYTTDGELEQDCFDDLAIRGSYSAIEHYIMQEGAKNENLIKYLRGEVKEIKL